MPQCTALPCVPLQHPLWRFVVALDTARNVEVSAWQVSNVTDREGFLKTLEDTLGFAPKVDFNAGVISAGDAVIESTVVGNQSKSIIKSGEEALKNQTQVLCMLSYSAHSLPTRLIVALN